MIIKGLKSRNFWFLVPCFVMLVFASRILPFWKDKPNVYIQVPIFLWNNEDYIFYFLPFKDTFFYLGNDYIEICLKSQLAFHFARSGEIDTVKISSGNKFLSKAIETPIGLYAVQNKAPIQISRQFENTEMLNWIGFNGNIGFHGLKKTGYYFHLGRKPSSHGCVRMSNEDGIRWYRKIKIGTPVMVYHSNPKIVLKFAKTADFNPNRDILVDTGSRSLYNLLNRRLEYILNGEHYQKNKGKIFLANSLRLPNSTIIVEADRTPPLFQKQKLVHSITFPINTFSTFVFVDKRFSSDTCKVQ